MHENHTWLGLCPRPYPDSKNVSGMYKRRREEEEDTGREGRTELKNK